MRNHRLYLSVVVASLLLFACHSGGPVTQENTEPKDESQTAHTQTVETTQNAEELAQNNIHSPLDNLKKLEPATRQERDDIREIYTQFKNAVLSYHGAEAVSLLSQSSLQYYDNILVAARTAITSPNDYKILEKRLSPSIHATAAMMVKRLAPSFILSANASQLYETAFNQGWIGYKTLTTASVDNLTAYEKNGKRYLIGNFYYANAKPTEDPSYIGFEYEDNRWKIDLVPIFIAIDFDILHGQLLRSVDSELSFQATIDAANDAEKPENWPLNSYKTDGFSVRFPRAPLFVDNQGERIYTSQDYRYGQFDVRVKYYDANSQETAFYLKSERDRAIGSFVRSIGGQDLQCSLHNMGTNTLIACDFNVPAHDSKGRSAWIFTPDRQYQLLNIARTDQFDPEVVGTFMNNFAFGTE
ncbi:MAG: hypothetical protein J6A01_09030 [Proteobacteria bacterium]|nr:hypothetical protein [Pseudomonadota bacterium]